MLYALIFLCMGILLPPTIFAQSNKSPDAKSATKSEDTCKNSHSGDSSDRAGVFGANAYIGGIAPSQDEIEKGHTSGPHVFFVIKKVSEDLDPVEICKLEKANLNQIRYCYQEFLRRKPGAQVNFSLDFKINTEGKAEDLLFEKDKSEAALNTCISKFMQKWRFPKPVKSLVSVQQTFKFYIK